MLLKPISKLIDTLYKPLLYHPCYVILGINKVSSRPYWIPCVPAVRLQGIEMDLSKRIPSSSLQKAKMLFVFMFMMRGLPFVDLAFLHKKDLQGNVLSYRRRKTGRTLRVLLSPEALQLVHMFK